MGRKLDCPTCMSLVIGYTNALQVPLNDLFQEFGMSHRATPKATWKKYGGHCVYCGQETDWALRTRSKDPAKQAGRNLHVGHSPQIDHWIPISRGGPPTVWNMLLSCRECNGIKGNNLQPYPEALLSGSPELAAKTSAALELVKSAWGELSPYDAKAMSSCELANYIARRWQDEELGFGRRFPKLSGWLDGWTPFRCQSIDATESQRLIASLECETALELYS